MRGEIIDDAKADRKRPSRPQPQEHQQKTRWYPFHHLIGTFSKFKHNYPFPDEEWLFLIYAMTRWRHCLHKHFLIFTYHVADALSRLALFGFFQRTVAFVEFSSNSSTTLPLPYKPSLFAPSLLERFVFFGVPQFKGGGL